jgi:hypothetical protein
MRDLMPHTAPLSVLQVADYLILKAQSEKMPITNKRLQKMRVACEIREYVMRLLSQSHFLVLATVKLVVDHFQISCANIQPGQFMLPRSVFVAGSISL